MIRCDHCPLSDPSSCRGERNRRLCDLVNPSHHDHDPAYLSVLSLDPGHVIARVEAMAKLYDPMHRSGCCG